MKKQLKTIILAACLLISNAIVGNAQEPTPQFNPVGIWKITAIGNVDIQCPLLLLPLPDFITDDNFDLAGSEYEVVETSDGMLNIIDNTDSQRYTETSRQPPNRYNFELQYQDTDGDITINITDTVTLILSSDEDAIGIGTLNYEGLLCQATYTVKVKKQKTASSILKNISLSSGTLTPSFNSATKNYMATVGSDVTQVSIIATADSNTHIITFNGRRSNIVQLNVGDNTITIRVITAGDRTTADGMAMADYNLAIRRLSTATLTGLTAEVNSQLLTLRPNFSTIVLDYKASIESTMTRLILRPTADTGRMIRIRYTPQEGTAINQSISSGNSISIMPFFYGENNIYIDVTHNSAMESYVLHVLLGLRVRAKLFLEGPLR